MFSAVDADFNNELKDGWVKELKEALKKPYKKKDVEKIVAKIDNYYFSE